MSEDEEEEEEEEEEEGDDDDGDVKMGSAKKTPGALRKEGKAQERKQAITKKKEAKKEMEGQVSYFAVAFGRRSEGS